MHQTTNTPDPEEINSIELGYMTAFKDIPLTMDVKLFKEHISPVINYAWDSSTPPTGAGNFKNDGKVDIDDARQGPKRTKYIEVLFRINERRMVRGQLSLNNVDSGAA